MTTLNHVRGQKSGFGQKKTRVASGARQTLTMVARFRYAHAKGAGNVWVPKVLYAHAKGAGTFWVPTCDDIFGEFSGKRASRFFC